MQQNKLFFHLAQVFKLLFPPASLVFYIMLLQMQLMSVATNNIWICTRRWQFNPFKRSSSKINSFWCFFDLIKNWKEFNNSRVILETNKPFLSLDCLLVILCYCIWSSVDYIGHLLSHWRIRIRWLPVNGMWQPEWLHWYTFIHLLSI